MVLSALQSTELAIESGLRKDQIIISCKTSRPRDLIAVYRDLARQTDQPLHLGLTEAGMGMKGLVWSASAMGVLLNEGIGDTIRVSLTPRPGGDRRDEVRRMRAPAIARAALVRPERDGVPGCGRILRARRSRNWLSARRTTSESACRPGRLSMRALRR